MTVRHMELSIEAKLAVAVLVAFVTLGVGAIAQERSEYRSGALAYSPASGSEHNQMTARRLDVSLLGLRGGPDSKQVLGRH